MLTIEFVRREKGLSQAQVGALAGMRQSDVGLIERGRLLPSVNQLARIAEALGIRVDELLQPVQVPNNGERRS